MPASSFSRVLLALSALSGTACAQTAASPAANGPAPLVVYFKSGSAAVRPRDEAVLDRASRAYNEGHPIVMSLTGSSDKVGPPGSNLRLSEQRTNAVLRGLVARGIPVERFQLVAKGQTDLPVDTGDGVAEERNRRVEISWR